MSRLAIGLFFVGQLSWALPCAAKDEGKNGEARQVERGYFGVSISVLDEAAIKKVGEAMKKMAPKDQLAKVEKAVAALKPGLQIVGLKKNGPADKAGLKHGDIITSVNGQSAEEDLAAVQKAMQKIPVGEKMKITYLRIDESGNGTEKSATITPIAKGEVDKLADAPLPTPGGGDKSGKGLAADRIETDFDKIAAGSLPDEWKSRRLGDGETADWQVKAEGGKARNVMQILSPANKAETLNLCINDNVSVNGNIYMRVLVKPVAGDNAQAGGIIWGYQNKNNFYMAVVDFKNNQAILYKIADGKPQTLDQKPHPLRKDGWTDLRAEHTNGRMLVRLDGVTAPVLDARDRDFRKGKVGLVTLGDSDIMFDEMLAKPPPRLGGR
jgi:hypothetical protein